MKCGHYHKGIVKRSAGQSAGNFCSYDMRCPLQATDGTKFKSNNTDMSDFVSSGIITPDDMQDFENPADMWASIEKHEKRKDAQLAARIDFALPNEFDTADIDDAVHQIMQAAYPDRACTYAAHKVNKYGQDNLHVHMLVTLRPWDAEKNIWGQKYRPTADRREDLRNERAVYTSAINRILDDRWQEDGVPREYWTALSYEDQYQAGIIPAPRIPSKHAGVKAKPWQRRGQAQIVALEQMTQDHAQALVDTVADYKTKCETTAKEITDLEDQLVDRQMSAWSQSRPRQTVPAPAPAPAPEDPVIQSIICPAVPINDDDLEPDDEDLVKDHYSHR